VIVPTSRKPKPKAPKQSIKSPFLSSPAAVPSLLKSLVQIFHDFLFFFEKNKLRILSL